MQDCPGCWEHEAEKPPRAHTLNTPTDSASARHSKDEGTAFRLGDYFSDLLGVARRFNVPEQAVGFLVVGLGTSLPELTVAIDAVVQGVPELAAGNALGANFVNLLVVLPVAALFGPLSVPVLMLWMDAPVLLLALVLVFATLSSKAGLTSRRTARFVCV